MKHGMQPITAGIFTAHVQNLFIPHVQGRLWYQSALNTGVQPIKGFGLKASPRDTPRKRVHNDKKRAETTKLMIRDNKQAAK